MSAAPTEGGPSLAQAFEGGAAPAGTPPANPPAAAPFDWRAFLKRETGAGDLSGYADHALNPEPGTRDGARVARGLDGITGGANLAILDIAIGAWGLLRRRVPGAGQRQTAPPAAQQQPPPAPGAQS